MKFTVTPAPKLTVVNDCWKLVMKPVMTTLAVVPACAVPGKELTSAGTPASTLNPPTFVATSAPVVTVGVYEVMVAVGLMVMLATPSVASLATNELTVMPEPKLATLQLGAQPAAVLKWVNAPVSATLIVDPCVPVGGFTALSCAEPLLTVKPPRIVATSPPVVRTTLYAPSGVLLGMEMPTVALVRLLTVSDVT